MTQSPRKTPATSESSPGNSSLNSRDSHISRDGNNSRGSHSSRGGNSSRGGRNSSAKIVARIGLLASLALIFSYVEAIIPYNPGIPGIKLGIANVVTVIALYKYSWKDAAAVSIIRIIIAGLLFNGAFGMLYSLAGAVISLIGMILLKKTNLFSVIGVSMAAGVLHNLGQLLIAAALIEDLRIFFYFPVLLFSGIAAGILVGIVATAIIRSTAPIAG